MTRFWPVSQIGARGDAAWNGARGRSSRAVTAWGRRGAEKYSAQWRRGPVGPRGDFEKGRKEIPGPRNWLNAVELEQVAADNSLVFTRENRIFVILNRVNI